MTDTKKDLAAAGLFLQFSPFCRRLCSKKLVFRTSPPKEEADVLDGAGNTWCSRTMDAVGPDGEVVGTDWCQSGRECFQPYGVEA